MAHLESENLGRLDVGGKAVVGWGLCFPFAVKTLKRFNRRSQSPVAGLQSPRRNQLPLAAHAADQASGPALRRQWQRAGSDGQAAQPCNFPASYFGERCTKPRKPCPKPHKSMMRKPC